MNPRKPLSRPKAAGFTLMEVLLALTILGFIMVSISQILTGARRTRDTIHNIEERLLAGPAILERLESDLRAIVTYNRDPELCLSIEDRVVAGLDADRIDFVSSTDSLMPYREHSNEDFTRADINEVGYCLRPNPDSDDFLEIYRREDFGVDEEPFRGGRYALLFDRVKGFNIEVFDEDGPEAEPLDGWTFEENSRNRDDDEEQSGLPTRISIELTVELAPRLVREQVVIDRRTVTYRRIIRFSEAQRMAVDLRPVPRIPVIEPPVAPDIVGGSADGGSDLVDPGSGAGGGGLGAGGGGGGGRGGSGGGGDGQIFTGGG